MMKIIFINSILYYNVTAVSHIFHEYLLFWKFS